MRNAILLLSLILITACARLGVATEEPQSSEVPAMRWDHRPEATQWTLSTMGALKSHGAVLPALVPDDIETWCPAYPTASMEERRAFWTGLFSALAKHESTWNPAAVGGGGRWYGLVQIDPRTARGYGCRAQSGPALKDGNANLNCAVRIATSHVSKRGTFSSGMRDWGPFHSASKRAEMSAWTRSQDYCKA